MRKPDLSLKAVSNFRVSPRCATMERLPPASGFTADRGPRPADDATPRHRRSFGLGHLPNWGWSWPANRRVLYNRASCDLTGKPYDPTRKQVWWNETAQKWVGNDVPDFKPDSKPEEHMGPFIMNPEGVGTHSSFLSAP